jgi:sec-independent protein translocase protein TatA
VTVLLPGAVRQQVMALDFFCYGKIRTTTSEGARMFEGLFQPMHLLIIFGIALLVFGPKKLPELGKGIGDGIRGFKNAMKDNNEPSDRAASRQEPESTKVESA